MAVWLSILEQKIRKVHCSRTSYIKCLLKKEKVVESKIKEKEQQKASLFQFAGVTAELVRSLLLKLDETDSWSSWNKAVWSLNHTLLIQLNS